MKTILFLKIVNKLIEKIIFIIKIIYNKFF